MFMRQLDESQTDWTVAILKVVVILVFIASVGALAGTLFWYAKYGGMNRSASDARTMASTATKLAAQHHRSPTWADTSNPTNLVNYPYINAAVPVGSEVRLLAAHATMRGVTGPAFEITLAPTGGIVSTSGGACLVISPSGRRIAVSPVTGSSCPLTNVRISSS